MTHDTTIIPGSIPTRASGWHRRGPVAADRPIAISVYLRERGDGPPLGDHIARARGATGVDTPPLTYGELAHRHGPARADLAAVEEFAARHLLTVGRRNAAACSVELAGRAADISRAFAVSLIEQVHPHALMHGRIPVHHSPDGPIHVPRALEGVVLGVAGLNSRPLARAHFTLAAPDPVASGSGSSPRAIADAYGVPRGACAAGQTIGVIALGGGYTRADVAAFCRHPSVAVHVPVITDVPIHGGSNSPTNGGDPATADGEAALDIQVIAAIAPEAAVRVYFAPNTDRGFVDSVAAAVRDGCTAVSISWGAPEVTWPFSSMIALDRICQAAVAMGTPIFAAAGDNGSTDGLFDMRSHADFPSSSPHVVACGGTVLPQLDRSRETAWNDLASGGGAGGGAVSDAWSLPAYQAACHPPVSVNDGRRRRTTPDLAANASPSTGYRVMVGGRWYVIGGTSAVSPLLSGMTALINAELAHRRPAGRLGDFHTVLYTRFATGGALQDISDGSTNGGQYFAREGYDAVTGWGTPNYGRMLELCRDEIATPPPPGHRRRLAGLSL